MRVRGLSLAGRIMCRQAVTHSVGTLLQCNVSCHNSTILPITNIRIFDETLLINDGNRHSIHEACHRACATRGISQHIAQPHGGRCDSARRNDNRRRLPPPVWRGARRGQCHRIGIGPELLKDSTIYVTLEPCSHYGKTPPCSQLIIDKGLPRVVVGSLDPYEKVSGRGVKMLRDAGIEVTTESSKRSAGPSTGVYDSPLAAPPWVTLKWAQSADGYIDRLRDPSQPPAQLSTPLTATLMHRQRTMHDAIMAGSGTVISDNPSLTPRLWPDAIPIES